MPGIAPQEKGELLPVNSPLRLVLLGISSPTVAQELAEEIHRLAGPCQLPRAGDLAQLRARLAHTAPQAIFLDGALAPATSLANIAQTLAESAPVVALADTASQTRLAPLVAKGDVEIVLRHGDFIPLAAALLVRRMRWAEQAGGILGPPWEKLPEDFSEILRHEINNPLTGILGNAELVLGQRERLPALAAQRLETVVSLAVRLRETVRRVTLALQVRERSARAS
ncbi:MAG: histidine kinase dimerization/phospho-acceptor domain-containing protein [Steroidobacteraceae bacterium]